MTSPDIDRHEDDEDGTAPILRPPDAETAAELVERIRAAMRERSGGERWTDIA